MTNKSVCKTGLGGGSSLAAWRGRLHRNQVFRKLSVQPYSHDRNDYFGLGGLALVVNPPSEPTG
jgi:hypothetical protein